MSDSSKTLQSDVWRVYPGGFIRYENAFLYEEAKHRVLHSRRLRDYYEIILGDGVADNADHLRWAAKAPAEDVAAWAKRSPTRMSKATQ